MASQLPVCDLLLQGGSVVTVDNDRRVVTPGAVAIAGDRIVAVGTLRELLTYRATRTVDCAGKAVIPGFVDCHNHLFQGLARGLGEGPSGWEWLATFMWPYAGTISADEVRVAAYLGAIEAAGTTSILDHHYGRFDFDTTMATVRPSRKSVCGERSLGASLDPGPGSAPTAVCLKGSETSAWELGWPKRDPGAVAPRCNARRMSSGRAGGADARR